MKIYDQISNAMSWWIVFYNTLDDTNIHAILVFVFWLSLYNLFTLCVAKWRESYMMAEFL